MTPVFTLTSRDPRSHRTRHTLVLAAVVAAVAIVSGGAHSASLNDLNGDGVVDLTDLQLFSMQELSEDWQLVNWCEWAADPGKYYERHAASLIAFIIQYFGCNPLEVLHQNLYPTRLAWAPGGRLIVSDAEVGSVFIYEASQPAPSGELKHLETPLGVAVDAAGNVYVGSRKLGTVEVYGPTGALLMIIGQGQLQMPNALALDQSGHLYVADSQADAVLVFDTLTGALTSTIGVGELRFPVSVVVTASEIYVASQGTAQIKVFDLQGNLLRSLGGPVIQGMTRYAWQGRFVRLQSIAVDDYGRLHAADSHMGIIQVLDHDTGAFLTSYGTKGSGPGQLDLPLDIAISGGQTAVANAGNRRIDFLAVP